VLELCGADRQNTCARHNGRHQRAVSAARRNDVGIGIGNATSLPPLIAQVEFVKEDVSRAVALVFATGQAIYAFAPAAFGLIRQFAPQEGAVFFAAALIQMCAIGTLLLGRYATKSVRAHPQT
jgi:hypothetical protein